MSRRLSKAEAQAFRTRWRLANEREEQELQSTPLEVKLQQFNTLLAWAHQLGWTTDPKEEAEVRERWVRLRNAYRGKAK
ncbi:MAG TPA: hypothetical protein VHR66_04340 [Gemmataceae bacterium]|jgi:hypothetical protein|nr:hypothetical protein [Gemmataceae bacterium]